MRLGPRPVAQLPGLGFSQGHGPCGHGGVSPGGQAVFTMAVKFRGQRQLRLNIGRQRGRDGRHGQRLFPINWCGATA